MFDLLALGQLERCIESTPPWPAASWNTVASRSPACMAASASWVASTPPTTTDFMSTLAAFIAWMAPMALSSLLAITPSNGLPVDSQLVIRFWASSRFQFDVCLSMILMKAAIRRGDHFFDVLGALHGGLVRQLAMIT